MWIDIRTETLLAAAKKRWPSVTSVASPHWIDTEEPLLRVGVTLDGCTHFGACYNYRTGEFEG